MRFCLAFHLTPLHTKCFRFTSEKKLQLNRAETFHPRAKIQLTPLIQTSRKYELIGT